MCIINKGSEHQSHYTPKNFSWSSYTLHLKSNKGRTVALMRHAWFCRINNMSLMWLATIYSQLRHRRWMSHSDRINEATHVICVLQQLKLG